MRGVLFASVCVSAAACSFTPGVLGGTGDALQPEDARSDAPDAPVDAFVPQDAPDATVIPPSTTDHFAAADTWLSSIGPDINIDYETSMLADGDPQRVVVIRFDLTSISTQATVTGAQLRLATWNDEGATVSVYPVLESWDETTVTWNSRTTNVAWTTAGVGPPSRGATAIGSVLPAQQYTEYFIAITPTTVGGWVANPASNHGVVLVTTEADGTRFAASEHANAAYHPYLRVTHVP